VNLKVEIISGVSAQVLTPLLKLIFLNKLVLNKFIFDK